MYGVWNTTIFYLERKLSSNNYLKRSPLCTLFPYIDFDIHTFNKLLPLKETTTTQKYEKKRERKKNRNFELGLMYRVGTVIPQLLRAKIENLINSKIPVILNTVIAPPKQKSSSFPQYCSIRVPSVHILTINTSKIENAETL